jgi:hypothetical protein
LQYILQNWKGMEAFSSSLAFLAETKLWSDRYKTLRLSSIYDGTRSAPIRKEEGRKLVYGLSEVSRFPHFAVVLALQLVVVPHCALGAIAAFLLHCFFRFSSGTKKSTHQLRLTERWTAEADAHFRVLRRVWNHNTHFPITPPFAGVKRKTALRIETER